MAKKSIKSRYTIEYVNPESPAYKKSSTGWWLFFFTIIGLLALGLTASVFYPFKTVEQLLIPVVAVESQEENLDTEIDNEDETDDEQEQFVESTLAEEEKEVALKEIEQLTLQIKKLQEEKQQKLTNQLAENEKLTKNIDELNSQLVTEKKKNEELDTQLDNFKNKNSELTDLLAEADKRYNSAQSEFNKKEPQIKEAVAEEKSPTTEKNSTVSGYKAISDEIAEIESAIPQKEKASGNSQVDSIIAAMQGFNKSASKTQPDKTSKSNQTISSSETKTTTNKNTQQLHEKFDKQIGRLSKTTELQLAEKSNASNDKVRSIVVKKGETLWDIAERIYGNGSEYKRIIEANPQITKNGKTILKEGQTIRVPI